jgi:hypothetical protein
LAARQIFGSPADNGPTLTVDVAAKNPIDRALAFACYQEEVWAKPFQIVGLLKGRNVAFKTIIGIKTGKIEKIFPSRHLLVRGKKQREYMIKFEEVIQMSDREL